MLVGTSFRTAPIELREKLSRSVSAETLQKHRDGRKTGESFALLSTCNRVEIYALTKQPSDSQHNLEGYLTHLEEPVKDHLYSLSDRDALKHLITVASGMDSMVLGEPQILLQVKHAEKLILNGSGGVLSKLLRQTYSAGKRIREEAEIDSDSSISSAALNLIRSKRHGKPSLLILGGGKMAINAIKDVKRKEFGEIYVANRTPSRMHTASPERVHVHSLDNLPSLLVKVDAAIIATSSPTYLITKETLRLRSKRRRLLLVDISMPRSVDPGLARLPKVELYNIDDLTPYGESQLNSDHSSRVNQLIDKEAARLASWLSALDVVPLLRSVRTKAEEIRREEMELAVKRLSGVRERDAEVLSAMSSHIINRLLHEPTVRLREHSKNGDSAEYGRVFRDLFGIND